MRRRSFGDEAAIEAAVDHLLRGFDPLDEQQVGPAGAVVDPVSVPIADSYVVASRTFSRPEIVAFADFVTNESADQVEINAAFASTLPDGVPGTGGQNATVVLAAGRYEISGLVTIQSYATLTGTGMGSNIIPNITGLAIELDTSAELSHITFVS